MKEINSKKLVKQNTIVSLFSKACRTIWCEAKTHVILTASFLAALITSFFSAPKWEYIDWKVIICLFELMLIVKALEEYGVIKHIAVKISKHCKNERQLTLALCLMAFFLAMLVTNDVAVITVIPILIVLSKAYHFSAALPCVIITVAANLGSSITPIGNPQNLYLFSFSKMNLASFFSYSAPLGLLGFIFLLLSSLFIRPNTIELTLQSEKVTETKKTTIFILLAVIVIAGVTNLIPYIVTLVILLPTAMLLDRKLLLKPDYRLLLTFILLFIAVGNISHISQLKEQITALASTPRKTYVSAILLSQVISNVPAAIMLAPFTQHMQALFYGVNIGGMGTPIASLASLLAVSLYSQEFKTDKAQFFCKFFLYNLGMLIILGVLFAVFMV